VEPIYFLSLCCYIRVNVQKTFTELVYTFTKLHDGRIPTQLTKNSALWNILCKVQQLKLVYFNLLSEYCRLSGKCLRRKSSGKIEECPTHSLRRIHLLTSLREYGLLVLGTRTTGVVSQCQIALICAIARARSRSLVRRCLFNIYFFAQVTFR